MFEAIENGDLAALKQLIDAGADLTLRDALGATPLLLAIENHRLEALDLLLERGADADDQDGFGVPALTRAYKAGSLELARRLLDAGASAAPRCKVEHRPLRALIEMFPEAGGGGGEDDEEETEPFDAERALAMVWKLLVKGAKVNDPNLLSAAVAADEPELIRLLVDSGADWRQPGETGDSLIAWAVSCGALEVVDLLLEWGADPTSGDEDEDEDDESTGEDFDDEAWDDEEEDEFDDEDEFDEMLDSRF